jgi:hypothetical protein
MENKNELYEWIEPYKWYEFSEIKPPSVNSIQQKGQHLIVTDLSNIQAVEYYSESGNFYMNIAGIDIGSITGGSRVLSCCGDRVLCVCKPTHWMLIELPRKYCRRY